jgi:SAM-dependent methyltransferase
MASLRQLWRREQFDPTGWGLLVNPFYFARRGLRDGLGEFLPDLSGEVLDVGCGRQPYRHLTRATRYVGVDIDTPDTRALGIADVYYYDGKTLPFADASFDAVLCSQVLEHVFTPAEFMAELRRVLRPGGRLLLATPLAWDEHSQPYDFARYTSFGLRDLVERAGFDISAQRKTCADFRAIVQLASGYLFKVTHSRHRLINHAVQLVLLAPLNLAGGVLAWLLPGNADLYLDNIVLAKKR